MEKNSILINYKIFFINILVLFICFSQLIYELTHVTLFFYLDELLLLISFANFFTSFKYKKYNILLLFSVFILFTLSILFGKNNNYFLIFLQIIIHLKLFFLIFLFSNIYSYDQIIKLWNILVVITIFGILTNFLFYLEFYKIFNLKIDVRDGFQRISGFQLNPNNLGLLLFINLILFHRNIILVNRKKYFIIILFFLIFLTGSRTFLFLTLLYFLIYFLFEIKLYTFFTKTIFIALLFLILNTYFTNNDLILNSKNNIEQTRNPDRSGYIRGIMIYNSFNLFLSYFPFGSGSATFGTLLSSDSKVYKELGLAKSPFFLKMKGVYDSNFASITGEFGFVGLFLFFLLFKSMFNYYNFIFKNWFFYFIVFILLFSSFTYPILMNSYSSILLSLFFLLIFKNK